MITKFERAAWFLLGMDALASLVFLGTLGWWLLGHG